MRVEEHVEELRRRLIVAGIFFFSMFVLIFLFSSFLLRFIISWIFSGVRIVTLFPLEPLVAEIEVSLVFSIFFTLPFIVYQLWAFISPALTMKERRVIKGHLIPLTLVLLLAVIISLFLEKVLIVPLLVRSSALLGASSLWSVRSALRFAVFFSLAFAFSMGVPYVVAVLVKHNIIKKGYSAVRPFFYVGAFILAALITPPDVLSQLAIALPMIFFFELIIRVMRR